MKTSPSQSQLVRYRRLLPEAQMVAAGVKRAYKAYKSFTKSKRSRTSPLTGTITNQYDLVNRY